MNEGQTGDAGGRKPKWKYFDLMTTATTSNTGKLLKM
jgi:hypothetical protein